MKSDLSQMDMIFSLTIAGFALWRAWLALLDTPHSTPWAPSALVGVSLHVMRNAWRSPRTIASLVAGFMLALLTLGPAPGLPFPVFDYLASVLILSGYCTVLIPRDSVTNTFSDLFLTFIGAGHFCWLLPRVIC